jgi:alkylation response protein AidB-like acyl-CoA dehydrogenase
MLTVTQPAAAIKAVETLLPTLRERRADIEASRRMPRDIVEQLRGTGVFSLAVPRVLGGAEATPLDMLRAVETAAIGDGSAGWCVMIGLSGNMTAGYMDEAGARDVFTDPSKPTAGLAAPAGAATRVDGGVRVSGRWPFASGVNHCEWLWAGLSGDG